MKITINKIYRKYIYTKFNQTIQLQTKRNFKRNPISNIIVNARGRLRVTRGHAQSP